MVRCLHVECLSFVGIAELGVLGSFNVCEHHEDISEEHVWLALDSNLSSQVFSQAVHEAFDSIIVVLSVACVMLEAWFCIALLHAIDGEQWV